MTFLPINNKDESGHLADLKPVGHAPGSGCAKMNVALPDFNNRHT
jgi:hypothetical protein